MTNTTINITPILEGIISLVIATLSMVVIPKIKVWLDTKLVWLNTKLTASQMEVVKIMIKSFVSAAEQIYINTSKSGVSKKKYVMDMAKAKLAELGYTIDEKEIEAYLEQAVREMNKTANFTYRPEISE